MPWGHSSSQCVPVLRRKAAHRYADPSLPLGASSARGSGSTPAPLTLSGHLMFHCELGSLGLHSHWPGPVWVVNDSPAPPPTPRQSVHLECFRKYMIEVLIFIWGGDHI